MKDIIIFSDFACPFCYIGFSIMERLNKERDDISFNFLPTILNPDETLSGSSLYEHVPKEIALEGYQRIESLGSEYGLVYNNKEKRFNTNRLHKAALYANDNNRYFEFAKLAFQYIFEYGKNIGQFNVVDEIAEKVGLNIQDMNEKIDSGYYDEKIISAENLASIYKVDSVPTFIVDGNKKPTDLQTYNEFIKELLI